MGARRSMTRWPCRRPCRGKPVLDPWDERLGGGARARYYLRWDIGRDQSSDEAVDLIQAVQSLHGGVVGVDDQAVVTNPMRTYGEYRTIMLCIFDTL
jgi:hypothetical protein